MRKLKLQVQLSVDGFAAGPNGQLDWMVSKWDKELENFTGRLHTSIDTILLGRKMTDGFISYWSDTIKDPSNVDYEFGKLMIDTPKIVFSWTINESHWPNTIVASGNTFNFIRRLKEKEGKDLIVYGGAGFVSSLVRENLIDEYYLFINPAALGKGMTIFGGIEKPFGFNLVSSRKFECGIVVNQYEPAAKD